eukprot:jgi/Galph1/1831/GphlegSOOS_G518.1
MATGSLAIIGGTALLKSSLFSHLEKKIIKTPYGSVIVFFNEEENLIFLQRHHADASLQGTYQPPHAIQHKANMMALSQLNVKKILAVCSVGSLKPQVAPGTLIVPHDFAALFSPVTTLFEDQRGHSVPGIDQQWRKELIEALQAHQVECLTCGVYVQTTGPRFETPAESKFLSLLGDIVGMTAATEAVLTGELGIPYAMLCSVDNYANGIASQQLSAEEFQTSVVQHQKHVENIVSYLVNYFHGRWPSGQSVPHDGLSSLQFVDSLITARWIVTMNEKFNTGNENASHSPPKHDILEWHTIVISNGIIQGLVPYQMAKKYYRAKEEEYLTKHCILPGLVNAHTHAGLAFLRGLEEDQNLMKWLQETVWPIEAKYIGDSSYMEDACTLAMVEMIRSGVTCFNDMYWFPEITCRVASRLGIRAMVGIISIEFPSAYASDTIEYLTKGEDTWKQHGSESTLHFCYAPHAPYTVKDETWKMIIKSSHQNDLPIHTHLHETTDECESSSGLKPSPHCHLSDNPSRPIANLKRLGLLDCHVIAAHMVDITNEELTWLSTKNFHVVHCPTSNMKLGCGFSPIERLLDAGINVALGTDSCGSNNSLDILQEVKLAALLAKGRTKDSTVIPAYEALSMATCRGARALGLSHLIGSIAPGKAADITAIDLVNFVETTPVYDPVSCIVYSAKREQVTDVWVQGRRLLNNRNLCTITLDTVLKKAQRLVGKQ